MHYITRQPPLIVSDSEKLLRGLFRKEHYSAQSNQPKKALFLPPRAHHGDSGLSSIRLDFSSIDKSKYHCQVISDDKRQYKGFACFIASIPRSVKHDGWTVDVEATPLYDKPYPFSEHADINYFHNGNRYVYTMNETLPSEVHLLAEALAKNMKCFIDPDPTGSGCPSFVFKVA